MKKPTPLILFLIVATIGLTTLYGQSDRPNIVWVTSEDNSKHFMGLYEPDGVVMPNLEALAEQGIVFNYAFSNAPVCSVARSTIISGCYAPRVGAQYHRRMKRVPMPEGLRMFPAYLKESGYYTTNNSKEDYNLIKTDDVWDDSSKKASYRNRKTGQPFFHVQNFGKTHEGQLHFTKAEMEEDKGTYTGPMIPPFPYHPNTDIFKFTYRKYYQHHQTVDEQIGRFIDQLKADGLMDNTIIFYFADHGGVLPRSKGYAYESGLHIPMVVYFPKKWQHLAPATPGSRIDGFVQFIDLAPTVLHLAGISLPKGLDGQPFLGKGISKFDINQRISALGYADRFDEKYDFIRTYRKGNLKYIRNYQPFNIDGLQNNYRYKMLAFSEWRELYHADKLNPVQQQFFKRRPAEALYDLSLDPHETKDLSEDIVYRSKLEELRKEFDQMLERMPDLSFFPEPYFLTEGLMNPTTFGQKNKGRIKKLKATADLALMPFAKAQKKLAKALKNTDPWIRYWALIVCSTFGEKAASFYMDAQQMATKDSENLVRMRAAEFLGLTEKLDPTAHLISCLKASKTEAEAALVLNTITLMKDLQIIKQPNIQAGVYDSDWAKDEKSNVSRRLWYLNGGMD